MYTPRQGDHPLVSKKPPEDLQIADKCHLMSALGYVLLSETDTLKSGDNTGCKVLAP